MPKINLEGFIQRFNSGYFEGSSNVFLTGTTAFGISERDSDVDIVVNSVFLHEHSDYSFEDAENTELIESNDYPDTVFKKTVVGVKFDIIVPCDDISFEAWRMATKIVSIMSERDDLKEKLRDKDLRVGIFQAVFGYCLE